MIDEFLTKIFVTKKCYFSYKYIFQRLYYLNSNLGIMDGPETSFGASNFVPSWMYWQKLPRSLQYPKTVILHRKEHASWGFSIVGGADSGSGRPTEPIHVLFVVPASPAAKDGKLK